MHNSRYSTEDFCNRRWAAPPGRACTADFPLLSPQNIETHSDGDPLKGTLFHLEGIGGPQFSNGGLVGRMGNGASSEWW